MPRRATSKPRASNQTPRRRQGLTVSAMDEFAVECVDSPRSPKRPRTRSDSVDSHVSEEDESESPRHHGPMHGFTESGQKFVVPQTRDTWQMLARLNEVPTLCTWFFMLLTVYVGLPDELYGGVPVLKRWGLQGFHPRYLLGIAIFWRLMYNVVLGYVLDYQSRTKGLTRAVRKVMAKPDSLLYRILASSLRKTVECDAMQEKPAEYNAWALNTNFVNIILPNDVMAFTVYALRMSWLCGKEGVEYTGLYTHVLPGIQESGFGEFFQICIVVIGGVLIGFSLYGKLLSHRVIGYYAWFWGDFFFKIDKTLKFDGIFEVFPHPMYTVGYAWMYGLSMWAGSVQVLAMTMFCHLCQMGFLAYMENPHISRTYGVEFPKTMTTHKENIFIVQNFDPFRASDWMMAVILILQIALSVVAGGVFGTNPIVPDHFFIGHALISAVGCRVGIAFLLHKQGSTKFWSNHFLLQGRTREEGFEEWKRLQNLLESVCNISFCILAWRQFEMPPLETLVEYKWSYGVGAMCTFMALGTSYWSSNSCYSALGDFGWFYGDFFLRQSSIENDGGYVARGIYRYFSHPDILFGKFWLHAIAFVSRSKDCAAIAVLIHALCLAQLLVVEEPHMKRIYTRRIRRVGLMETLKKLK